jgi:hypothetical protein
MMGGNVEIIHISAGNEKGFNNIAKTCTVGEWIGIRVVKGMVGGAERRADDL